MINRRELFQSTGLAVAASQLQAAPQSQPPAVSTAEWLKTCRALICEAYEVEQRSGLMPQYMATRDTLLLHLIADTGNKTRKLRIREEFLSIADVKVRVRVLIHETVRVDLA